MFTRDNCDSKFDSTNSKSIWTSIWEFNSLINTQWKLFEGLTTSLMYTSCALFVSHNSQQKNDGNRAMSGETCHYWFYVAQLSTHNCKIISAIYWPCNKSYMYN